MIGCVFRTLSAGLFLVGWFQVDTKAKDVVVAEVTRGTATLSAQQHSTPSPIVSYDFNEGKGNVVHDRVGQFEHVDLVIRDQASVKWIAGGLQINSAVELVTEAAAKEMIQTLKKSGAFAIEAWIEVDELSQSGPARLISLSKDPSHRNFTLGQDEDRFDFRLRTTKRDRNGMPSTAAPEGSLEGGRVHVLVTRGSSGEMDVYQNGHLLSHALVPGNLGNWDENFRLAVGNEVGGGRPWVGRIFRVSIYDQDLDEGQAFQLYQEGSEGEGRLSAEQIKLAEQHQFFRDHVAPLLSNHCLECHDAAIRQGELDLSSKSGWQLGGDSGPLMANGDSEGAVDPSGSLIWERVVSDEMPHERAPLSAEEKQTLYRWLVDGGVWAFETIDPAIYRHRARTGEVWVQRLTIDEYIATVKATFGVDIEDEARKWLPADVRADGFSNTSYNMSVDLKHVEAYQKLAESVVEKLDVLKFAARFGKSRKLSTDDTMREQIEKIGRWVLRGPISKSEQIDYSGVATTVASVGGDFELAIACVLEAMIQSPRFIYRVEYQRGSGLSRKVSQHEIANRLSYILWGASPDEELASLADRGGLRDVVVLDQQIDRMLKDNRAVERSLKFIEDWLNLGRLQNLRPDPERFPEWNQVLATQMRQETLDYFVEVIWTQGRPLSDLLNAQLSILDPELAAFYQLPAGSTKTQNLAGGQRVRYDLSNVSGRGGILTQASVLTIGGDNASMVSRGLFVLHDLLRGVVNAPPPCVNTTPPATALGLTQRSIAEARIADSTCGVCHVRFEPLAFGLEKFNGIGAYHQTDRHGNQLRDDGEILFPGKADPVKYEGVGELMDLLAASERVKQSLTWKVVQFSLGRPLTAVDAEQVEAIHAMCQERGGGYRELMRSLIHSDLVQKIQTEQSR